MRKQGEPLGVSHIYTWLADRVVNKKVDWGQSDLGGPAASQRKSHFGRFVPFQDRFSVCAQKSVWRGAEGGPQTFNDQTSTFHD